VDQLASLALVKKWTDLQMLLELNDVMAFLLDDLRKTSHEAC